MDARVRPWDYLIVTASNEAQAQAYESQLAIRRRLGLLSNVEEAIVVPDPGGKRIGSGGSTLCCLMEVLRRRLGVKAIREGPGRWETVLRQLRILIIHAGGDSRRLPAYGPCGKIFVPVPGDNDSAVCLSLFDRQLPTYLALPQPDRAQGQVVIASGDVLLRFEPMDVRFSQEGIIALACHAQPEQASRHGVFCQDRTGEVGLYLQKPSIHEQRAKGAINPYGQSCLDVGVMHFDGHTAVRLMQVFGVQAGANGKLAFAGPRGRAIVDRGLDFYREICCALGTDATVEHYLASAKGSGSKWPDAILKGLFKSLNSMPFNVQLLKHCEFLDFGTSRAILTNGTRLLQEDRGVSLLASYLDINNEMGPSATVQGSNAWVEGCRVRSPLALGGSNVVVGADIDEPLSLPNGACLDVITGRDTHRRSVWFVRCYGVDDTFKEVVGRGAVFCGKDLSKWLSEVGAELEDVWDLQIPSEERTIWNARLFPAVKNHGEYRQWLWMLEPAAASVSQKRQWWNADRYSLKQILELADHKAFYARRSEIRSGQMQQSLQHIFRPASGFSCQELAYLLGDSRRVNAWIVGILKEAHRYWQSGPGPGTASLAFSRIIHTLGSALLRVYGDRDVPMSEAIPGLQKELDLQECDWLESIRLWPEPRTTLQAWARRAQDAAFESLEQAIVSSGGNGGEAPRSVLRSDEIVWARAPARLDVGGGWTDTPPYSLEWGGCVVNAAVDLNGQPPIQTYVRVIDEPVIRIGSIDLGVRIDVHRFDDLLDYRKATGSFALAKAALALSGIAPKTNGSSRQKSLKTVLEGFGGGIELTTLAAIPKGSGLGTSSIMGAVIVAALARVMGKTLSQRELFHQVLKLEQALTTGGGWQDQIGGVVDGVKMIVAEAGMIPDAHIHYVPSDILDPKANDGQTLLYYTGVTRLAKNILQQVVGGYLNRQRATMATLSHIGQTAREAMDAFIRKDIEKLGFMIDTAWQLNKRLDPNSSNEQIEALFDRVRPHVFGSKLLGAGGGGFMLMVCKSPRDAAAIREMLEADPPNERARFFDYSISHEGLVVTAC
jgi:galactokinase/mevalonate kinase-like predicted kinase